MSSTTTTPQATDPRRISRRGLVKGAAWSVPVIAAASTVPFTSATVTNFDLVYVSGPTANTTQVVRGQIPWADLIFQSAGPDPAPSVQITVRPGDHRRRDQHDQQRRRTPVATDRRRGLTRASHGAERHSA